MGSDTTPGRIVVVDDDRSARLLLERVLTRAGHQVDVAESGAQGLELLNQKTYELLITDKNLPDIDGLELLRRARALHPQLQAVLITGFPSAQTRDHATELGVFGYVAKPFGVHEILDVCAQALAAVRSAP